MACPFSIELGSVWRSVEDGALVEITGIIRRPSGRTSVDVSRAAHPYRRPGMPHGGARWEIDETTLRSDYRFVD